MTLALILSIYSAIISTFLFWRWVRREWYRLKAKKHIKIETSPEVKNTFFLTHPPSSLTEKDVVNEDLTCLRGFEVEMLNELREGVDESSEEREWRDEEMARHRRLE